MHNRDRDTITGAGTTAFHHHHHIRGITTICHLLPHSGIIVTTTVFGWHIIMC
jgi:hypothetical protein